MWVGLCSHLPSLASGILAPAYKLLGWAFLGSCQNGDLQESSHHRSIHWRLCLQCPCPQWAIGNPCLPRKPSKTHRQVWCRIPVHMNFSTLQQWSLFFPEGVLWTLHQACTCQALLTLRPHAPGPLFSQCQNPYAGEPDLSFRTPTPVRELLWYNYFPVCGWLTW